MNLKNLNDLGEYRPGYMEFENEDAAHEEVMALVANDPDAIVDLLKAAEAERIEIRERHLAEEGRARCKLEILMRHANNVKHLRVRTVGDTIEILRIL